MTKDEKKCRPKRHLPKQSRSQETFNAILEAAAELFSEKGYDGATTHAIAKRAGISVGGLYRYFSGKEPILKEVYQRQMTELRQHILQEFGQVDLGAEDIRALVRRVMEMAFRAYERRPELLRVLSEQSRKIPELAELRRCQEKEIHWAVLQILESVPRVSLPDKEMGAYLISLFLESLIDDHVLYGKTPDHLDEARLIQGAVDFLFRYVRGE